MAALGRVGVELDPAGERRRRAEVAEREVGVGHRRLVAAAPVAGGAGLGARGSRADPQRAAGIAPADRSAAGADRVHVDHRQLDHAAVELARVGLAHAPVLDHADVAGGAAHVEAERVAVAREPGEQSGADRAPGGPGEHAPGSCTSRLAGRSDPAGGHHHRRLGQAVLARGLGQALEVAVEQRREIGVDDRGRAALVLAELGQHLVRGRDVHVGHRLAQPLGDRPLVGRVEIGEQQADGDRLGSDLARLGHDPVELGLLQRLDHPLGAEPLAGLDPRRGVDQRLGLGSAQVVELRPVLARDLEQVGEPAGRDQRRPGPAALEQRVRAHGHPVGEDLDRVGVRVRRGERRLDRLEHSLGLVGGRGRRLGGEQAGAVEDHRVGERPADVDPEQHGRTL